MPISFNAKLYRKQPCQFRRDNDPTLVITQCLKYLHNKQL